MKIEVKNISKKFKSEDVLKDVNMTLEGGHIYAFVGRNGSGKSVLLKIICGFYKPTSGEVLFDGIDYNKTNSFPPSLRALIEHPSFLNDLSGYKNLEILANIHHKIGRSEIEKAMIQVGLDPKNSKKYGTYSLGMKQKLGIAQVIMENPDIMILDEPFNGVEEETVPLLRNLLLEKKKEGKLIVIASHIKEDIQFADDIYLFQDGIVQKQR